MTTSINIHKAIVATQANIKSAQKSGDNKFDKYLYSKLEDFYAVAKPAMAQHGLALLVSVHTCESLPDRTTKNGGTEHAVRVFMRGTLLHESGEMMTVDGIGEGQDRADKALYKAITGGKKYLLASLFSIPTTDDPEADETVGLSQKGTDAPKKLDSKGDSQKRKPSWTQEQRDQAGNLRAEAISLGFEKAFSDLYYQMSYDPVSDYIDKAEAQLKQFRDIADQANPGVQS